jgi:hypothetical protein
MTIALIRAEFDLSTSMKAPDMSDAVALSPASSSVTPAKGLNEQEKPLPEGADAGNFAALVEAMVSSPEALPAAQPGGELPSSDTSLPGDPAVTVAMFSGMTTAVKPANAPVAEGAGGLPIMAEANLSRLLATTARAPAPKALPSPALGADTARDQELPPVDEETLFPTALGDMLKDATAPDTAVTSQLGSGAVLAATAHPASPGSLEAVAAGLSGLSAQTERTMPAEAPKLNLDSKLPLASPLFAERFAEQITVLVEHGIKHAQISLNPPELGPIEVRISLHQDEAKVQFASHHGGVRDAMNEALPRLREMLENSGLRLSDSGVFAQLPQREQLGSGQPGMEQRDPQPDPWAESPPPILLLEHYSLHLVDAYA